MNQNIPSHFKMSKKEQNKISKLLNKLKRYFVVGLLTGFLILGIYLLKSYK
tara:strand:- start:305 stop:457 length:153 start_codon:yes stop_codon:yes gene_type:complete